MRWLPLHTRAVIYSPSVFRLLKPGLRGSKDHTCSTLKIKSLPEHCGCWQDAVYWELLRVSQAKKLEIWGSNPWQVWGHINWGLNPGKEGRKESKAGHVGAGFKFAKRRSLFPVQDLVLYELPTEVIQRYIDISKKNLQSVKRNGSETNVNIKVSVIISMQCRCSPPSLQEVWRS